MKARTAAAKLRLKRGRKLLLATEREPNGRQSRRIASTEVRDEVMEAETMETALAARVRLYSIKGSKSEPAIQRARDPRHGYVLGRLWLDGIINQAQHDAGVKYAEEMSRFFGLMGIAFPSARAQNLFAVRGMSGEADDDEVRAAARARARMIELRALLLKCGDIDTGRRVEHTVKAICLLDMDNLRTMNAAMRAWLVRGLNALGKHYGGT